MKYKMEKSLRTVQNNTSIFLIKYLTRIHGTELPYAVLSNCTYITAT